MNSVNLIGRITKDPELKQVGQNVCASFSVAVDRNYKDDNGTTPVDFINCIAWNTHANFLGKYVRKGDNISIVGRIQTRAYQTQSGETKTIVEVLVNEVSNLTPKPKAPEKKSQQNQVDASYTPTSEVIPDIDDDDLPF